VGVLDRTHYEWGDNSKTQQNALEDTGGEKGKPEGLTRDWAVENAGLPGCIEKCIHAGRRGRKEKRKEKKKMVFEVLKMFFAC